MRQLLFLILAMLTFSFSAHALLMVSPSSIQFTPTRPGGPTQFRSARVTNYGNSNTGNVEIYNHCFGQIFVSDDCGLTLRPQESCNVNVQFTPNMPGHILCDVSIESFPGGSDRLSIQAIVD